MKSKLSLPMGIGLHYDDNSVIFWRNINCWCNEHHRPSPPRARALRAFARVTKFQLSAWPGAGWPGARAQPPVLGADPPRAHVLSRHAPVQKRLLALWLTLPSIYHLPKMLTNYPLYLWSGPLVPNRDHSSRIGSMFCHGKPHCGWTKQKFKKMAHY